jgi:hypothetical protein
MPSSPGNQRSNDAVIVNELDQFRAAKDASSAVIRVAAHAGSADGVHRSGLLPRGTSPADPGGARHRRRPRRADQAADDRWRDAAVPAHGPRPLLGRRPAGRDHAVRERAPARAVRPFRGATSGRETYGAGRYLEVDRPGPDGRVVVDFNYAYNPVLHLQRRLVLSAAAGENWLRVPLRAGERNFNGKTA